MPKLKVLFENGQLLVVDKPAGINVHLGYGREHEKTLLHLAAAQAGRGIFPVHRLDRDTSGVIIMAKTEPAQAYLQAQFKARTVKKTYLALVVGVPKLERVILDWPLGRHPKNPLKRAVRGNGREAITEYRIKHTYASKEASWKQYALLEVWPKTGRTHQIRVHLAKLGHPIVGDRLYGRPHKDLKRHWLHAYQLRLKLPGGELKTFTSPLPTELNNFLKQIQSET